MFRNYLAAALRNLVRNKLYAAINLTGLVVAFTAALLMMLFVRDEFSYDSWIPAHDRIAMISMKSTFPHVTEEYDMAPYFAAAMIRLEVPGIAAVARLAGASVSVRRGEIEFKENILWSDPGMFDVVQFPAVAGDLASALQQPDGVVLTRAMARKYFGTDMPIGQTLEFDRKTPMKVTAILEDLPSNTHFNLGIIASGKAAESGLAKADAHSPSPGDLPQIAYTYARLKPGASLAELRRALPLLVARHHEFQTRDAALSIEATPIDAVHLHPPRLFAMKPAGDANTAIAVLLVAVLIVSVAGINFINLTTAFGARRAVEVGVRKTSGAERHHLIGQFICESIFHVTLAMTIAIILCWFFLPVFNGYLQRTISYGRDPMLLALILAAVVVIGVAAGAYPAFVLSRFTPARVLKGVFRSTGNAGPRRFLVTLQFAVLIGLGLTAAIIEAQLRFATNEGLRFNKDLVLEIDASCHSSFALEVRRLPGIVGAACAGSSILQTGFPVRAITADARAISASVSNVDFGYFELFDMAPLAGRLFSPDFGGDMSADSTNSPTHPAVIINETMAHALGFAAAADAVGQSIRWQRPLSGFNLNLDDFRDSQIVGIVPDFARGSVRTAIPPTLFQIDPAAQRMLNVKLDGRRLPETLAAIDQTWKRTGEPHPLVRAFLDQSVQALYLELARQTQVLAALAAVTVFIAALGLFGLSAFTAESRTKEIGVRKAMGAGSGDILRLLVWEFAKPVLWANAIAWPAGYFFLHRWLEGFAYHIDLQPWMFIGASVIALAIAVVTVAGHAILVARAQPVAALRYE